MNDHMRQEAEQQARVEAGQQESVPDYSASLPEMQRLRTARRTAIRRVVSKPEPRQRRNNMSTGHRQQKS